MLQVRLVPHQSHVHLVRSFAVVNALHQLQRCAEAVLVRYAVDHQEGVSPADAALPATRLGL